MRFMLRVASAIFCMIPVAFGASSALAEVYPSKSIRLIVPFPSGGGLDIVARLVAQELSEKLGQTVVVDNRSGAGGTLGMDLCAKAPPDGYTIVMGSVGPVAFAPSLYKQLPYDPVKDFEPVMLVAILPNVLLTNRSSSFKTVQDLVAQAKGQPGKLNYASAGVGTPPHLSMEMFKAKAGIDITHVPYKGGPPALTDLIGGRVQVMFINVLSALPLIKSGQVLALAVTSTRRSAVLPDVPTMAEAGRLPGFSATDWFGILAPAGTPPQIVQQLNTALAEIVSKPEMNTRLAEQGAQATTDTPVEFAAFIKSETKRWSEFIKSSDLKINTGQ